MLQLVWLTYSGPDTLSNSDFDLCIAFFLLPHLSFFCFMFLQN